MRNVLHVPKVHETRTGSYKDSKRRNTYCVVIFIHELFVVLVIFYTGGSNTYTRTLVILMYFNTIGHTEKQRDN